MNGHGGVKTQQKKYKKTKITGLKMKPILSCAVRTNVIDIGTNVRTTVPKSFLISLSTAIGSRCILESNGHKV